MQPKVSAICKKLIRRQSELTDDLSECHFLENAEANALLNDLREYPHAFVLACLMDRQQPTERCWIIPYSIQQRLGTFDFGSLSSLSLTRITSLMSKPQPLHRFTEIMAGIFYEAVQRIRTSYCGDAAKIWGNRPSSATIVRRFLEFDGAGPKIATMAANILVREFKIPVSDRVSIDISADVHIRRVFKRLGLVREGASNEEIIYTARELNPLYPGIFDLPVWEVGRKWCSATSPDCGRCYLQTVCSHAHSCP